MLSQRFNAREAAIVATKAAETLDSIDSIIEKSILDGNTVAYIPIYDNNILPNGDYTQIGKVFREAVGFLLIITNEDCLLLNMKIIF